MIAPPITQEQMDEMKQSMAAVRSMVSQRALVVDSMSNAVVHTQTLRQIKKRRRLCKNC